MSTAIVQSRTELELPRGNGVLELARYLPELQNMADVFLKAKVVNSQLDTLEKVLAVMFKAHELGVSTTYALEKMSVINGNITMEAELMLSLIYTSGACASIDFKESKDSFSVTMVRLSPKVRHTATFSLEDANRAGLLNKEVWRKYPKAMLRWRAVSECAKVVFSDVLSGAVNKAPIVVRMPQTPYELPTENAQEYTEHTEAPNETAYTPVSEPEPKGQEAMQRPFPPHVVKDRILTLCSEVRDYGEPVLIRKLTSDHLLSLTADKQETASLLRYFFGKSSVGELSVRECKSLMKWVNVSENGDLVLADSNSIAEFQAIMSERGYKRLSNAEKSLFPEDDETVSNTTNYDAIAD